MKNRFLSTLPLLLLLVLGFESLAQPMQKPNVLFIVVDDMNTWGLVNDYPVLKVPNLRKLLSQSLYFQNATCAAPKCIPSRASFFSGKYPHNTGVYQNGPNVWGTSDVLTQVEALPELFNRNGYTTWAGGKTFHVPLPGNREEKMWDNNVHHGGYGPWVARAGQWFDTKPWEGPDSDFTDVVTAEQAMAFLGQQQEKPFFMYWGLYRPHNPYTAPKRFYDLYEGVTFPMPPGFAANDLNDVPPMGQALTDGLAPLYRKVPNKEQALQTYLKAYCANYSFADWSVGRVLDALEKSPYAQNTLVIFASDNGFHNGTKNHWTKETLWEQATTIPLLIRLPNGKGVVCPQTVSLIDIYPTLVEYCNLSPPKQQLDGLSMMPVLKNPKTRWERPGLTTTRENYSAVRTQQYRYIKYADGSEELYDHQQDPYELKNLAQQLSLKPVMVSLAKQVPSQFKKSVPVKGDASDAGGHAAAGDAPAKKKGGKKVSAAEGKKRKAQNQE
ncbi:sulfatase [Rufibacter quisquiliarum]|uniref:Arylsulfatase A-like enzyme n=1 Tax=Rufibacter quisquiliarum TaxID=1549639 RepID=A0A839GLI4_9BACT|nr:sulfatase [Rufibacter quisquiliarum]MBA9075836.1 arylsulfatase A-like enzyme [Rufibacter quisquiliarum]